MEETTIVIMLKDEETGFLDQELGSYSVPERDRKSTRLNSSHP